MATNFKIKRSAVEGKRPATTDLELGELALNTYDGFLYSERTGHGAGVSLLTPWREKNGEDIISYTGAVGIGSTDPEGKLDVIGNVNIVVPTTSNYQSLLLLGNDSNQAGLTADLTFDLKNGPTPGTGKARITTGTPTSLVLGTQGSESIHIDTMGRVGIGTTHPKIEPGGLYVNKGVNVAGLSTFHDDVNFIGATGITSITFDKSENEFKLLDYSKLVLGEGGDATIQHDSFRTIVRQHGTGPFVLDLLGNNKSFEITKSNLSETLAKFNTNGSVDLFYAGGIRFETTGYGVTVYGEAQFTGLSTFLSGASFLDNDVLYFGGSYSTGISTDHRLRIYSDGTDSYISEATGAGHLILSSDSRVEIKNAALNHTVASFNTGIGVTVNDRFKVVGIATLGSGASGQVFLQYGGSTKLTTQSWGTRTEGTVQALNGNLSIFKSHATNTGQLLLQNQTGDAFEIGHTNSNSFITGHVGNISINAPQVSISTHFSVGGISTFTGNIIANGNVGIGTDSPTARLHISGPDAASAMIKIEDNNNNIAASQILVQNGGRDLRISAPNDIIFTKLTSGNPPILYLENGQNVGIGTDNPGAKLDVFGNTKLRNDLDVDGVSTLGSIGISTGRITGPAITYIDPATVGDDTGLLVVKGNLQVDGTQTIVNSSVMRVNDKNIVLAKNAANDAAADTGGITVESGDGDKTWKWLDATDSWTSSEHIRIPDDKAFGFATDTNTFISRPVADTITFTHGGSEKVRITSDGEVGIGTTNPGRPPGQGNLSAKLHVSSTDLNTVIIERSPNSDSDPYGSRIAFIDAITAPGQGAYIQGYNGVSIELGTSNGPRFKASDAQGGRVGINTDNLDVMGFYVLDVGGSTRIKGNVVSTGSSTTGISTVVGVGTFKDDVYIDKKLYVGGIEIGGPGGPGIGTDITTRHLTVTGFSTFTGAIDANGDLDVDGHTNLDNVSVAGVSTFSSSTGSMVVSEDNHPSLTFISTSSFPANRYRLKLSSGRLYLQVSANSGASYTSAVSVGGIGNIFIPDDDKVFFGTNNDAYIQHDNSNLNIINTTGNIDVTGDVVLNNDLNVTGVSTFVSFLDVNDTTQSSDKDTGSIITEGGVGIEKNLNVGGIINSSTDVQINGTSVVDSALNDAVAMAIALG